MKITTMPEKRLEVRFSRTEMEVMAYAQLVNLKALGTPYERMHAAGILEDRKTGQTQTHGRAPVPESISVSKPTTKSKEHGNLHGSKFHDTKKGGKHAYPLSGINDPSLRRRNRQSRFD